MSLNIKNPEAHQMARQLSRSTGETLTEAVTQAIRERLQRVEREQRGASTTADLLAIGRRCAANLKQVPVDHGDLLYDEHGLPK